MGTNKLGSDDGRTGGTSVVDLNTKVYGTDNLFVVDASIFPGMSTGNPSAMIVIASEYAADRILALPIPTGGVLGDTCGGKNWKGAMTCAPGLDCHKWSDDVSTVSQSLTAQPSRLLPLISLLTRHSFCSASLPPALRPITSGRRPRPRPRPPPRPPPTPSLSSK